jgi:DNA-binding NtrC family response regulator
LFGPTRTLSPEVAMLAIELRRIAPAREPVLLLGETGCG